MRNYFNVLILCGLSTLIFMTKFIHTKKRDEDFVKILANELDYEESRVFYREQSGFQAEVVICVFLIQRKKSQSHGIFRILGFRIPEKLHPKATSFLRKLQKCSVFMKISTTDSIRIMKPFSSQLFCLLGGWES